MEKNTLCLGEADLDQAVGLLANGGLVALPTETVYGLAADGLNTRAVEAIYEAKGRWEGKPLSVFVTDMEMVERLCRNIPEEAYRLAEAFWPGPLTLVLPDAGVVSDTVTAGGNTLGVRCPDHPITLEVVRRLGRPLAAPSANPSGLPSPKDARAVLMGLSGKLDAVVDGGPCTVAVESTIVDLTERAPRILRQGGLEAAKIWAVLEEGSIVP